jgi:hypothetical protein
MQLYNYVLNFDVNSLNTDKFYNIYFEENKIGENVTFPHTITFSKWQTTYDIIVENTSCGSRKNYTLLGRSTTTFPVPIYPTTNPVWIRPTTTVRPPETTQPPQSTTTKVPKTISIDTLNVVNCMDSSNGVLVNTVLTFKGNYSGKLLLQITDVISGNIVRRFDGGVITTNMVKYNLLVGNYKFEIKDFEDEAVKDSKENMYIYCPTPYFDVEYIPNNCGKSDAKIRIYNIVTSNKFRWCAGSTFVYGNLFDKPDAQVDEVTNEVTINLNTGVGADYINGDYITVRGFNHSESNFIDVAVEMKPCVPNPASNDIYVTALFKGGKPTNGKNTCNVLIYLLQDGKKINAPTDISIGGYFTVFNETTYVNEPFNMIVQQGDIQTNETFTLLTESFIFESCLTEINPKHFGTLNFINNSGCN